MKKRLEAELISIAHRILKLKNKSEVDQLYKETQKLYETLTVLKFYQDNFESVKDEIEAPVLEEKLAQHSEAETPQEVVLEVKPIVEAEAEPAIITETDEAVAQENPSDTEPAEEIAISEEAEEEVEPVFEEAEEVVAENESEIEEEAPVFKPIFELGDHDDEEESIESAETASEMNTETKAVALEELLGGNYVDPIFVKPNEVSLFSNETIESKQSEPLVTEKKETAEPKTTSLNTAFSKSIEIGLNDRVAFVNNLFGGSNEDFNRVLSQLNTFDSLEEAKTFLNEMVIPDYNYWVGKEEYIERFMEVVEKKFA